MSGRLAYRAVSRAPMMSYCPACGFELHSVKVDYHYGVFIRAGLVYWQYCDAGDCTWLGRPMLFEAYIDESEAR